MCEQQIKGDFFRDNTAADCNNCAVVLCKYPLDTATLGSPVSSLPVEGEKLTQRQPGFPLNFSVKLDERDVQILRQHSTHCGLARTTQANKSNPLMIRSLPWFEGQYLT